MRIIQIKGIVKDGEVKAKVPQEFSEGEVNIVIVAENEPDELEKMGQIAKNKGYNSKEKILELIKEVKLEMLEKKTNTTYFLIFLDIWENILSLLPSEEEEIEDSKEEILADLKQSILDGKRGKTFPIEELWEGIES
ncbi:hypothetical protein [Aphanothece sacrum]|uniref:Uncharacterized protein n=1 Tax=Aphanothece sacrum FPU1 TaxID=1920663 RepID=A0A401ID53_APHSA|nr:hypothetical protein [Aphanothece sacrum]GBF79233.1 hypothetical protein AsFPU1_0626 [Aphanothece sacrum FPU1]GBF84171.1 hypothetical protein AsFPU3_1218 [Aphanothece sacrum FPU3]